MDVYSVLYAHDYTDIFKMPALCLSVCLSMGICLGVPMLVFQYLCVFLCFCPCGTVDICALNYIGLFMWRGEEARRSRRCENQCWASRVEIKTINSKAYSVDSCLSVLSYLPRAWQRSKELGLSPRPRNQLSFSVSNWAHWMLPVFKFLA